MEFYIRTQDGQTFNVETLKEALTILVGPNGYRLSIKDPETGAEIVIRCDNSSFSKNSVMPQLYSDNANLVVRGI